MSGFQEYRLWIVSIFGSLCILTLFSIWQYYYFKRRKASEQPDFGLMFLCAGLMVWTISAIMKLAGNLTNNYVGHSLSMINNGLIACSFPFFEYSVISDQNTTIRRYWSALTLSLTGVLLLIIYIFGEGIVGTIFDFLSSATVLIILTGILFKTFDKRKLKSLGYLSILVTVAMLFSQFFITFEASAFLKDCCVLKKIGYIAGGISYCMFILLLVALAFTWILDRSDVYDGWKDEETIAKLAEKEPTKALEYLISLISSGLSKYDLNAFKVFFDALPGPIRQEPRFIQIYHDYLSLSGQLNNSVNHYLQNLIDFSTYQRNCSQVGTGLLDIIERLRSLLLLNNSNQNV